MSHCTWLGCGSDGIHEHKSQDGSVWATLCGPHHAEVEGMLDQTVPKMMAIWVAASGGPKVLAGKMTGERVRK